ncbi:MAG TPA: YceI family protein [Oligoflexus sp.]|uniref:YceI family protein n=1 Tax=Oligoflexus sp. TaxID=1971216 RepID=UPI002D7E6CF2|nr:YceI family protein [Oligoflexus sp.]HET9237408.1 YceI family protein [Oligoflexus sp.]
MTHVPFLTRCLVLTGLFALSSHALGKAVTVNLLPDESKVSFKALATLLTIQGKGSGVRGSFKISGPKAIEGKATLPLDGLTTEMSLRDKHMKSEKTLYVAKYPEAVFVPTQLPWEDPSEVLKKKTDKAHFEGKLTLHGVEKPVSGDVSTEFAGDKVKYTFNFQVKLSDHDIPLPSFSGVKVKDDVEVMVETPAKVVVQ